MFSLEGQTSGPNLGARASWQIFAELDTPWTEHVLFDVNPVLLPHANILQRDLRVVEFRSLRDICYVLWFAGNLTSAQLSLSEWMSHYIS